MHFFSRFGLQFSISIGCFFHRFLLTLLELVCYQAGIEFFIELKQSSQTFLNMIFYTRAFDVNDLAYKMKKRANLMQGSNAFPTPYKFPPCDSWECYASQNISRRRHLIIHIRYTVKAGACVSYRKTSDIHWHTHNKFAGETDMLVRENLLFFS